MTPLRLRLSADASRLAGFDTEAGLEQARSRLRLTRDDVVLTHVEQLATDAIGVVFLVTPAFRADEIDDIATDLRAALGIGLGTNELVSSEVADTYAAGVRGIGGESAVCSSCGLSGGRHLADCPRADG
jgi:hypothetical protein